MRFYSIISDGIFFVVLFHTLRRRENGEQPKVLDCVSRFTPTIMFTLGLALLTVVSAYRDVGLFRVLPDHELAEVFTIAIIVCNVTEFALSIPKLFYSSRHGSSPTTAHHLQHSVAYILPNDSDTNGGSIMDACQTVTILATHSKSYSSFWTCTAWVRVGIVAHHMLIRL
jgi:hypothetical protein